jgi:hypothetical protein
VGKLSLLAILTGLQPWFIKHDVGYDRTRRISVEDFVRAFRRRPPGSSGSLDVMVREADRIRAQDVMVPVDVSIDEGATLEEAVYALTIRWTQSILVTRSGEVVGILRLSDVFQEVTSHIGASGWPDSIASGST